MLLVGDNGAGKSTLLRVLAGEFIWGAPVRSHCALLLRAPHTSHVPHASLQPCPCPRRRAGRHIFRDDSVSIMGKNAFYDTSLNSVRAYLAGDWGRRTVAFTGHGCALQADVGVSEMMKDTQTAYLERRDFLADLLGVDLSWRMHQLSDGQRRRVQIMLQLLRPSQLLLLDEITTDLDLITRQDFLNYIRSESETNGLTVVYATHIFDGLDDWATHIGYVAGESLRTLRRERAELACPYAELSLPARFC